MDKDKEDKKRIPPSSVSPVSFVPAQKKATWQVFHSCQLCPLVCCRRIIQIGLLFVFKVWAAGLFAKVDIVAYFFTNDLILITLKSGEE